MYEFVYKTIPELEPSQPLTGQELFEAVQDGRTVKVTASDLFSKGPSAYEIAVQEGFTGTQEEWLASLTGLSGKSAYQSAVDAGYVGTEQQFNLALAQPKSLGGAVFITDVRPQFLIDNVGNKQMSNDGYSLVNCSTTSHFVQVHVMALTGYSSYKPVVTVNDVSVDLTPNPDAPIFMGFANIRLLDTPEGVMKIRAEHADGAFWETSVVKDIAPTITTASFSSEYPTGQTELKAGDVMNLSITADQEVVAYEVADFGAFVAATGTLTPGLTHQITNLSIADRGTELRVEGFRIRVKKATGSWSPWYDSEKIDAVPMVDVVSLNNTYPTIDISSVTYPAGQSAIKNTEAAFVNHTLTNADTVEYTAAGLSLISTTVYEAAKQVTAIGGTYAVGVDNFHISATRTANGATSIAHVAVAIAQVLPEITISVPQARLRSGGNAGTVVQNYPVTISSNQALAEAPSINAPEGSWVDPVWTSNAQRTVWTRRIAIHDNNIKGSYSFNSLVAKGLSGLIQNAIAAGQNYVIGGFVFRKITVAAFPNREANIGTNVSSAGKLRCTNLSKGATGTLNATYKSTMENEVDKYTITGPSGTINPKGNLWYNLDAANASSNTSGTMQIEIEEVV